MAKFLSTKQPVRFVPGDQENRHEAERVTYLLRAPTPATRPRINRALKAACARPVHRIELINMMEQGVKEVASLVPGFEKAEETLAAIVDLRKRFTAEEDPDKRFEIVQKPGELVDAAANALRAYYPPYAELEGESDFFFDILSVETVRHGLVGWENLDQPFQSGPAGASDASIVYLQSAQPDHVKAIWLELERLANPSMAEAKNSDSSSPSDSSPSGSTSAATKSSSRRKAPGKKTSGNSGK